MAQQVKCISKCIVINAENVLAGVGIVLRFMLQAKVKKLQPKKFLKILKLRLMMLLKVSIITTV